MYSRYSSRLIQRSLCTTWQHSALGLIGSCKTSEANRIIARFVTKSYLPRLPLFHYDEKAVGIKGGTKSHDPFI
jgi:hypothetical protein